jgi:tRNA pseudouridine55 synthase
MVGVLNVAKPSGPTSHDMVARLRRLLGVRRIGHSGTLDPLAAGVLLLCVGPATRLVEYLNDLPKTYHATVRFGCVTETQDSTGTLLAEADASGLTAERVAAALAGFRGKILQTPPMYSALKVGGRRLYERARQGEVVERQPRQVTVYALDLREFRPGAAAGARIEVTCSAGTYVRTLCHDLGARLGPGATMSALTRTAIGPFTLAQAVSLEELARRREMGEPLPWIPLAEAVAHLPAFRVDAAQAAALRQGKRLQLVGGAAEGPLRLLDTAGALVAIGRPAPAGSVIHIAPEKVFLEADDPD